MEELAPDADALISDRIGKGLDRFDEKHFGRYVVVNAPGRRHAELVGKLLAWLTARGLYTLVGVNVGDDRNFRIPDVNAWAEAPAGDDFFAGESAPTVVVEVLSPSNTRAEMAERERHYVDNGVVTYVELNLEGEVVYANEDSEIVAALRSAFA